MSAHVQRGSMSGPFSAEDPDKQLSPAICDAQGQLKI